MRALVLLATVFMTAVVAVAASGAGTSTQTDLRITFWDEGQRASDPVVWTLRCDPARGTHPRTGLACRRLEAGGWKLVAPVAPGAICTEIYGGPQVARVVGSLEGRKVWATFTRTNGCHISRWDRLSPWLLPNGGVR
ncbi:MAG: hypothetical protein H0U46_03480 [Actinobacteria bacterium]|nr:hypothetical protein [Actinomycetota bacterium]